VAREWVWAGERNLHGPKYFQAQFSLKILEILEYFILMSQSIQVSQFKSWFMATRPKTVTTALIPIIVGTALAQSVHQTSQLSLSALAFLSAVFIQIGTNLINDALDFKKGADTEERIGPTRVTQSGLITEKQVWWGGIACFAIATLLALPLVLAGGWPIVLIGVFSLIAGYAYTGGPFPLAYIGMGDFFVIVFFGWVAVSGVYYLNTGVLDLPAWIAGSQVGLMATVLIAINNFRDHVTDRKARKKTLAVRFGPKFARMEIALLCFVPFLFGVFWFAQGYWWASILPLFASPLAFVVVNNVRKVEPSPRYNQFLGQGALLHLGFGILLSLGLALQP
jgi:1,4-dihydroxy-2-naphthoate octaprenyltransferase